MVSSAHCKLSTRGRVFHEHRSVEKPERRTRAGNKATSSIIKDQHPGFTDGPGLRFETSDPDRGSPLFALVQCANTAASLPPKSGTRLPPGIRWRPLLGNCYRFLMTRRDPSKINNRAESRTLPIRLVTASPSVQAYSWIYITLIA
jgi:hypothetical protein